VLEGFGDKFKGELGGKADDDQRGGAKYAGEKQMRIQ
jgi:hypothetical protein